MKQLQGGSPKEVLFPKTKKKSSGKKYRPGK